MVKFLFASELGIKNCIALYCMANTCNTITFTMQKKITVRIMESPCYPGKLAEEVETSGKPQEHQEEQELPSACRRV